MKLTAHILRVKQVPAAYLLLVSLLTGLGLMLLWSTARNEDAHIDHLGATLTASMASQAIEPLIAQDLIHLSVLVNRAIALPEVLGATVHTLDDEMLALSGNVRRGRPFTQQVVHQGATIGLVRIHIDEAAFGKGPPIGLLALSLLWMCVAPLALFAGSRFNLQGLLGLPGIRRLRTIRARNARPQPVSATQAARAADAEPELRYLIAVNLFNQLSLTPEQCGKELAFTRETATAVADLYNGEVSDLPGTGLLVSFSDTSSSDRPFHVLCAAFALSELLAQAETWGRYRLGIHTLTLRADEQSEANGESLTDVAVLSALAKDNTLVVSHALFKAVPYAQRVHCEPMNHPLLDELETIGGGAYLAHSLADPHNELVAQQVMELSYSDRSTASESTF